MRRDTNCWHRAVSIKTDSAVQCHWETQCLGVHFAPRFVLLQQKGGDLKTCLENIREAAVLVPYRARPDHVRLLVGDDAKQFRHVADEFQLCWIHEGRTTRN